MRGRCCQMRKVHNRIENLVFFKGVNHSYRIINIKIVKVDIAAREIRVDAAAVQKIQGIRAEFLVEPEAIIATKNNNILSLSGIKPGNRVIIDFIKSDQGQQLAKGITILK